MLVVNWSFNGNECDVQMLWRSFIPNLYINISIYAYKYESYKVLWQKQLKVIGIQGITDIHDSFQI